MSFLESPALSPLTRALFRLLLGSRLPVTSGALEVEGAGGPVAIRRDRYGIPMIEAEEELDVFFGFGFCQGQDRSVQIELSRRAALGTLSELFGKATLRIDCLFRRAGLGQAAREQFQVLEPRVAAILTAFAAGVNAGRTVGLPRRPHEFVLLRTGPSEFTPIDVLTIMKLQSFAMPSNWDCELARLMVLNLDGPEALLHLDPQYPDWQQVPVPPTGVAGAAGERLAQDLAMFQEAIAMGGGSNGWALSGSRTQSGSPLLANDPHLPAAVPAHWYLARLQSPDWALAGAALPGTPAIAAGHNGRCAWGVTAGLTDNTDLFLERIGPDGRSVLQDGKYVTCQVRREVIQVRNSDAVELEVLVTPRGPVISPALDDEFGSLSLRAVWLDPLPVRGFLCTLEASNFEEFRAPFADWPFIPLGLVYADGQGSIGYQLAGQAPRRRRGYGIVPSPGWLPRGGWEEEAIPFDQMPSAHNPPGGYVAAANTQPQPHGDGPFLGVDWIDGYRLGRLVGALEEGWEWDVGSTAALQLDVKSLPWDELKEFVLAVIPLSTGARAAHQLLAGWDGQMSTDSAAATVFHLFLVEMSQRIAWAKAPRSAPWLLGRSTLPSVNGTSIAARQVGRLSRLVREQPPGWFPRGWPAELEDALASAYSLAVRRLGAPSNRLRWGRARTAKLKHPLGRKALLDGIFNIGPFQCPGDSNTLLQAGTFGDDPLAGPGVVPSLRMVLEVDDWDRSLFCLPGGQSGNALSPHYRDLFPLWLRGAGVPIAWTDEAVQAATVETLLLNPR